MNGEQYLKQMETFFLALADKTRLRLLNLMRDNEVCVCFFTEVLGESQPKISRHLAYLRNAGIVSARRDGKWMHYKMVVPDDFQTAQILQRTLEAVKLKDEMQAEYNKLMSLHYTTEPPITISRVSQPNILLKANILRERKQELETFLL